MTDAEIDASDTDEKARAAWKRSPRTQTDDWSRVTHCTMPSGRVSSIHVVREDRVFDNLNRVEFAGNDVRAERTAIAAMCK